MSRRGWALFIAMCVIWGIPYLLIRVAIRDFEPGTLVFARTALPALILLPIAWHRDMIRPLLPHWRILAVYTVAEIAGPWYLLSAAEEHLTSSLTGLLVAAVPLIGILAAFAVGHTQDRLDRRRLLGLAVGFAGVVALVGIEVRGAELVALGQVALTAIGYAVGPLIVARRLAHLPSLGVIAVTLGVAAVGYAPYALTHLPASVSAESAVSVALLAIVCTALAFLLFFALIAEVGPARATVITFINPAVAVLLGVLLLGEPFSVGIAVGFPLILLGSFFATARNRRPAVAAGEDVCVRDTPQVAEP
ncbi:MAG TPA: DMT family transporter [Mycobacteriales bacterium]|jgi:drug/metabolite transporter (DMT)-like permease|nr:DMT family transporter [Mycobacteriales bacterium]